MYDIVGEEDWIHGKVNCLSSQTITLSWGARKKESIHQKSILSDKGLQVGNHVVVENHAKHWPHKAEIYKIDMINNTALVCPSPMALSTLSGLARLRKKRRSNIDF
jgi:hypothetical protein